MKQIAGLKDYVKREEYRKALGLPEEQTEAYVLLGQGEYNINYLFCHPLTGKKLVLRVNCGSQMHLPDQITYEYQALKLLESSGRTPKVFYVDGSRKYLDHGLLVMEFLPGRELDYGKDLLMAADCLADIHSLPLKEHQLLSPPSLFEAISRECGEMFQVYEASAMADDSKKAFISRLLQKGREAIRDIAPYEGYRCCINTELNSTNFLVEKDRACLIDWEKPLCGDPAQDLGHFLAPTTTFWKTDVILDDTQTEAFLERYLAAVGGRFPTDGIRKRTKLFLKMNCLRGITWCAMAWVQYRQADKAIVNESTAQKLEAYLSEEFLEKISWLFSSTKEKE